MKLVANLLVAFVALCHLGFLVLEMFFWNHPVGHRIFAMTPEGAARPARIDIRAALVARHRERTFTEGG